MSSGSYDRASFKGLRFHNAVPRFLAGQDNPRAYLERCLDTIAAKDGVVRAFVVLNEAGARAAADASAARYKQGRALSTIDGMPIGIKDLIETADMPTQMGCGAFAGNFPKRDSIMVRALRPKLSEQKTGSPVAWRAPATAALASLDRKSVV
jgi:Asp-tRNA(Asn)/Glu-tRNA(Gln) amidotransferase A subunit family amidase